MPRKRHVSRNISQAKADIVAKVMPRKRHVSRNRKESIVEQIYISHASQEACE